MNLLTYCVIKNLSREAPKYYILPLLTGTAPNFIKVKSR